MMVVQQLHQYNHKYLNIRRGRLKVRNSLPQYMNIVPTRSCRRYSWGLHKDAQLINTLYHTEDSIIARKYTSLLWYILSNNASGITYPYNSKVFPAVVSSVVILAMALAKSATWKFINKKLAKSHKWSNAQKIISKQCLVSMLTYKGILVVFRPLSNNGTPNGSIFNSIQNCQTFKENISN